jgi:hypothetical protein
VVCVVDVMTVTGSVVTSTIVVACSVIAVVEGPVVCVVDVMTVSNYNSTRHHNRGS